ncbi:MAG: universal stress protein, partial [Bacteroidota bacterium]
MYSINRVMVCLDLSDLDDTLIAYTAMIRKIFDINAVYFHHVAKTLDLPERIAEKYPGLLAPSDEAIEKAIQEKTDKYFQEDENCSLDIVVREGNPTDKILRWSDIKEIDLIVLGRKTDLKGSGVLPGELAKVSHCSLLFVPESAKMEINRILVPVDFSKTSGFAFQEALDIHKATNCEITLQNSYDVPSGYHTIGKSYEEFAEIMRQHAYEDAESFLKKNNAPDGVNISLTLDDERDPAERACDVAKDINADMIIIGSKGRTGIASLLLGSVADKMTQCNADTPPLRLKVV